MVCLSGPTAAHVDTMCVDGRGQSSRFWGRPSAGKPAVGNGDLWVLIQDACQSGFSTLCIKINGLRKRVKMGSARAPTARAQNFGSTVHLLCSAHMSRVPSGIRRPSLRVSRGGRPCATLRHHLMIAIMQGEQTHRSRKRAYVLD
jgi:hypothetical protein